MSKILYNISFIMFIITCLILVINAANGVDTTIEMVIGMQVAGFTLLYFKIHKEKTKNE